MYSNNKATSSYDNNAITVTPIKMEVDTSPAYPTPNSSGCSVAVAATTSARRSSTVSTSTTAPSYCSISNVHTTADAVLRSGAVPKDKPPKLPRPPVVRKPPPTIDTFWPSILAEVRAIQQVDAKHQALPLARIKKIMKLDENAKMIAAEAPLLFAKACEYFIQELTMRAWIHTEESKRRTLQRSDIAQAIANYDQFDFLIDIVPREDIKPTTSSSHKKEMQHPASGAPSAPTTAVMTAGGEMLSFGALAADALAASAQQQQQQTQSLQQQQQQQLQIIQQPAGHQQQLQYFIATPDALAATHSQQAPAAQQQLQIIQQPAQPQYYITTSHQQPQQLILTAGPNGQLTATPAPSATAQQQQNALLQNLAQQQQQQQQQQIQLLQQVVTPSGELTNVPIAINANQLNLLRLQMQPAAQQLLQLSAPTSTAHNVQQHQQQQQQHQQQQHSASGGNIFLSTAQQQSAQGNGGAGASGHSIVSTDRNLGSTYRPSC